MAYESLVTAGAVGLQALGVVAVVLIRMSDGGWRQRLCQRFCFAFLVLLAAATVFAVGTASHHWLNLAAALSIVSIGSTMQVR